MENYEKRYKEALERAKYLKENTDSVGAKDISYSYEYIFPELKESEDERIRKDLIQYLPYCDDISKDTKERWIAWLEKQGNYDYKRVNLNNFDDRIREFSDMLEAKPKPYWDGWYEAMDYVLKNGNPFEKQGEQKPVEKDTEINDLWVYIREWNEKFGRLPKDEDEIASCIDYVMKRQKPADKIEPKFKVGDWVVYNNANVYQVKKIDYTNIIPRYELENIDGDKLSIPFTADYNLRNWTIQDAKKGDVLYCKKDDDLEIIVMYLGINIHNNVDSYCRYNSKLGFNTYITNVLNAEFDFITPATKEQRNILLSKMKEASYEWDAEKKEFGKIEQGCYHNDGLYYAIDILEKTFGKVEGYQSDDGKMEHQNAIETVNSLYHKKPNVWSEEDEKMLSKLIKHFEWKDTEYRFTKEDCLEATNWLKSIKPNHWKPSEEQIGALNYAYCELFKRGENGEGSNCVHPFMTLIDDLKKL